MIYFFLKRKIFENPQFDWCVNSQEQQVSKLVLFKAKNALKDWDNQIFSPLSILKIRHFGSFQVLKYFVIVSKIMSHCHGVRSNLDLVLILIQKILCLIDVGYRVNSQELFAIYSRSITSGVKLCIVQEVWIWWPTKQKNALN